MLGKTPIFDSYDVDRDERRWASIAREVFVNDDVVVFGENQAVRALQLPPADGA